MDEMDARKIAVHFPGVRDRATEPFSSVGSQGDGQGEDAAGGTSAGGWRANEQGRELHQE